MTSALASVHGGPAPLPHSEETERAVLGAVLLEPTLLAELPIWEDLFYIQRHKVLLAAVAELEAEREPVDERTVQAHLEATGKLEAAGGLAYLAGLNLDLPDLGRAPHYVQVLEQLRLRREMIELGGWVARKGMGEARDAEQLIAQTQEKILSIVQGQRSRFSETDTLGEAAIHQAERYIALEPGHVAGVPTGLQDLDQVLGGFEPGRLIVIAGRPGMGKSALAQQIAETQKAAGHDALIVSLEMSTSEYATRSLVRRTGIPYNRMRAGWLSEKQKGDIREAARRVVAEANLSVQDAPGLTIPQILFAARAAATTRGLRVLWVDHVGLIESDRSYESRNLEVGTYSRKLKNVAKDLGITVVALSQLNRECERRGDKRPILADLRESGSVEQDADSVIFVHRPEVYSPDRPDLEGIGELIVAKNRDGMTGTVEVAWLGERMEFRSLARREEQR